MEPVEDGDIQLAAVGEKANLAATVGAENADAALYQAGHDVRVRVVVEIVETGGDDCEDGFRLVEEIGGG